jgi:hypothetical protein
VSFDPNKPVQTRDGRGARIVAIGLHADFSIVAVITEFNGGEWSAQFRPNGRVYLHDDVEHMDDLVNVSGVLTGESWRYP